MITFTVKDSTGESIDVEADYAQDSPYESISFIAYATEDGEHDETVAEFRKYISWRISKRHTCPA